MAEIIETNVGPIEVGKKYFFVVKFSLTYPVYVAGVGTVIKSNSVLTIGFKMESGHELMPNGTTHPFPKDEIFVTGINGFINLIEAR